LDSLEKEFDELIDTLGYDNYFVNTQLCLTRWISFMISLKKEIILWMWQ